MNETAHVRDGELIESVRERLPDDDMIIDLAELYKVFGDSTRLKILCALLEREICVNDIAEIVGMSISAVSHHLRVLKAARLVRGRRDGKTIYYSPDDDHVRAIINQGLDHVGE